MDLIKSSYYRLFLENLEVTDFYSHLIISVTLEETADGADMLHFTMADPDFKLISDSLFVRDKPVTFEGGWVNEKPKTFKGFVSIVDINFPENGTPTITLHCMDRSHLMNTQDKKRTWENTRDSEVARAIFLENGFTPIIDTTSEVKETVSQSNVTDIAFLMNLAKDQVEDFICYVEGDKGYFVKRKILDTPEFEYKYREDEGKLISFSPRINKEARKRKVINKDDVDENGNIQKDEVTNEDKRDLQGEGITYNYEGRGIWVKEERGE